MIKLACKIPKKVVLACSGGRDSMSALEFLVKGRRDVTVAYFNHGTDHGDDAQDHHIDHGHHPYPHADHPLGPKTLEDHS